MSNKPNYPLVSIIVPCYNSGMFLAETLESVSAQSYKNWECIILNDGSADNTAEVANQFCKRDFRFKYIFQNNQGVATARNNAIRNSSGEYILPLDGDDRIGAGYIEQAVTVLAANSGVKIVYCNARCFGDIDQPWSLPSFAMKRMLRDNIIFCTALFRRSDYDKTQGYNSNMKYYWEDWDFWLSILETGGKVVRLEETLFFYRIRNKSRNFTVDEARSEQMLQQLYLNHKNLFDQYGISPLKEWRMRNNKSLSGRILRKLRSLFQ